MNNHKPIIFENFKGVWNPKSEVSDFDRDQNCPRDHLLDCVNWDFGAASLYIRKRFSGPFTNNSMGLSARRIHIIENIPLLFNPSFLIADDDGDLYFMERNDAAPTLIHSGSTSSSVYFFLPYLDRIYVSESASLGSYGQLSSLYVVQGNGAGSVKIRNAGATSPGSAANVANSSTGVVQQGTRFFGVSFETDTGFITPPTATSPASLTCPGNQLVAFTNIPTGPAGTAARWLFATRAIVNPIPGGTLESYQYYPIARIGNNTTTSLNVNFYDSQLLNDMSYLSDIYENPPSGNSMSFYHNRLVLTAPRSTEVHTVLISRSNDPETFDQVTGAVIIDPTLKSRLLAEGLSNSQPYRDVLYLFKEESTYALSDNGDEPVFWPASIIDQTLGASVYGIGTTSVVGLETVDYLIISNLSGLYIFTGSFLRPELSWKDKNVQFQGTLAPFIINDTINKKIYAAQYATGAIYLIDYQAVSPDFSNYWQDVRISEWFLGDINGNGMQVGALFLWATQDDKILLLADRVSEEIYSFTTVGANTSFEDLNTGIGDLPYLVFPSISDIDGKLIHANAVKFRFRNANSGGTFNILLEDFYNPFFNNIKLINFISSAFSTSVEPTLLTNFMAQRIRVELTISDIAVNQTANRTIGIEFSKLITFVSPVYSTLPYQFIE